MARKISTILALVALLALSACNNVTGPATGSTQGELGDGGGDHGPDTFDSPDTITPGDQEGGGSGSVTHPLNRIRMQRRDRQREEVAPVDENGGGGGGEQSGEVKNERAPRRGKDTVTPGN